MINMEPRQRHFSRCFYMFQLYIFLTLQECRILYWPVTPRRSKPDLTSCGWAAGKWLMCLPQVFQFLLGTTLEDQANILLNICAHLQHILCNAYCCMSTYLRARCKYHKYHSLWALTLSRYALMLCNYDRWTDFLAWGHEGDGAYNFFQSYVSHGWCHLFYLVDMLP